MSDTARARRMLRTLHLLLQPANGQGMAEYGLILALVAVVVIVALSLLGTNISTMINTLASSL